MYQRSKHLQAALGDLEDVKGGIIAAAKIGEDPALPEVTCLILRMNRITEGRPLGPSCPKQTYTEAQKKRGIGLTSAVAPLRAAVWAREHPIAALGVGAALIGSVALIGYYAGKGR